ncbi:metalloendopeptidase [Sphingomonas paeninsulae]|uniref:Metalloendopeptidase n=1 Tax=Sphingomonas paeninsulae TaxID=2319844 RepID=A0A494TLP5_SPHPE|nr:peptidoglycan DD-metalloendopeptidase family protein [Sphingomonas paeninsulae]AYJ86746.1 metalloendopeptidase [Sphingomonas paeninsulae]
MATLAASAALGQSLNDERRAFSDARAKASAAQQRSQRLEMSAAAARNQAEQARSRSAAVAARVQGAEADIDAAEARIAIIERLRRDQRARLAIQQGPMIRLMAALQALARRPAALTLVQPGSLDDLVHVRALLSAIVPVVEARTAGLRAEVARGRDLRNQADRALALFAQSQQALVTQRNTLAALALERRRASDALSGSAIVEQDRALAMGEEARDIGELMTRIGASAEVRSTLETLPGPTLRPIKPGEARALPAATSANATGGQAPYRLPVIGQVITGLGEVSATGIRARGLTIATRPGAQVVAPTGGRIAFAGPYRGYGNIVIVDHGRGWTTLITSLAALDVRVGDAVDQGSPIGKAGASRPTITVELRKMGQPIDIARLIG